MLGFRVSLQKLPTFSSPNPPQVRQGPDCQAPGSSAEPGAGDADGIGGLAELGLASRELSQLLGGKSGALRARGLTDRAGDHAPLAGASANPLPSHPLSIGSACTACAELDWRCLWGRGRRRLGL